MNPANKNSYILKLTSSPNSIEGKKLIMVDNSVILPPEAKMLNLPPTIIENEGGNTIKKTLVRVIKPTDPNTDNRVFLQPLKTEYALTSEGKKKRERKSSNPADVFLQPLKTEYALTSEGKKKRERKNSNPADMPPPAPVTISNEDIETAQSKEIPFQRASIKVPQKPSKDSILNLNLKYFGEVGSSSNSKEKNPLDGVEEKNIEEVKEIVNENKMKKMVQMLSILKKNMDNDENEDEGDDVEVDVEDSDDKPDSPARKRKQLSESEQMEQELKSDRYPVIDTTQVYSSPSKEVFTELSCLKIITQFYNKPIALVEFLIKHSIMRTDVLCGSCGTLTRLRICSFCSGNSKRRKNYIAWTCPIRSCRSRVSAKNGSIFQSLTINMFQFFYFSYLWCQGVGKIGYMGNEQLKRELDVGSHTTILKLKNVFRDSCIRYMIKNSVQIGGPGRCIEIDVINWKEIYQNQPKKQRVLAGIDVRNKQTFLVPLALKKDEGTETDEIREVIGVLLDWVKPQTVVYARNWEDYARQVHQYLFRYDFQKAQIFFQNPRSYAEQNYGEGMWYTIYSKSTESLGKGPSTVPYEDYLWNRQYGGKDAMYNFWSQVCTLVYPPYPIADCKLDKLDV